MSEVDGQTLSIMSSLAKEEVTKIIKNDVMEEDSSPWASPVILVTKKNGTMHVCMDYWKLNDVKHKDA